MSATRSRRPPSLGTTLPPDAAALPAAPAAAGHLRAPRPDPIARVARLVGGAVVLFAASAVIEWGGWRILWRHGGKTPVLDAAWGALFLRNVGNNAAGALGVGAGCAAIAAVLTLVVPRWRGTTRRAAWRAFVGGTAAFLAFLGALILIAP